MENVLDYKELKKEFIKKQKEINKQKTAKVIAAARLINKKKLNKGY